MGRWADPFSVNTIGNLTFPPSLFFLSFAIFIMPAQEIRPAENETRKNPAKIQVL